MEFFLFLSNQLDWLGVSSTSSFSSTSNILELWHEFSKSFCITLHV